jgi:hypothetical protein
MLTDLADGDCGSWVFDKETSDVYGHIVSGYPSTGTAYIVPSVQIFQNIQHRIGKPVELFTHTSNKSRGNLSLNSDLTIRRTTIHDFDAPQPRRRLSNTSEHADRFLSKPLASNQLIETEHPASQTPAKVPVIPQCIGVPSNPKTVVTHTNSN